MISVVDTIEASKLMYLWYTLILLDIKMSMNKEILGALTFSPTYEVRISGHCAPYSKKYNGQLKVSYIYAVFSFITVEIMRCPSVPDRVDWIIKQL